MLQQHVCTLQTPGVAHYIWNGGYIGSSTTALKPHGIRFQPCICLIGFFAASEETLGPVFVPYFAVKPSVCLLHDKNKKKRFSNAVETCYFKWNARQNLSNRFSSQLGAKSNNNGGRKPSLCVRRESSSELSGSWPQTSDVITALRDTHQPIRSRHEKVRRSPCSSRRSAARQTEGCQLGEKKKHVMEGSPVISVYDRSVTVMGLKKHPKLFWIFLFWTTGRGIFISLLHLKYFWKGKKALMQSPNPWGTWTEDMINKREDSIRAVRSPRMRMVIPLKTAPT